MTINGNSTATFGRRRTLRAIGALAGVGLVASLGGTSAFAQQAGMPGMGATPPMGGAGQGSMPGMGGAATGGMMGGMPAMMQGMQGMMGMMMGPDADRMFLQEMIPHHQSAVSMATMAWGQTQRPEIKKLTEAIVRSQNVEIEQMAGWYRKWYGTDVPPSMMAGMGMGMGMGMTPPATAGAKSADQTFLEMMTMHHQMAVMMASMALGAYKNPELAKLEQAIIIDQAKEIAQMRAWLLAWYPA